MNIIDRWHLRAVANIFKEKSGKPFDRSKEDYFDTKPVSDKKKLEGYATLPMIKAVVNLIALITHGQGFSVKSEALQDNNDTLLKTTVNQFMMADRQISLTSKIDILVEWDYEKSTAILTPIPLEHVKARPDHINDSYVLEWNLQTMKVSEEGETYESVVVMKQIYGKEEIATYADGEILPQYSYPNTLGIQRIVTIHIQDLAGQDDPLIGVLEYNISTLYKQALNALGVVVKLTGEPDKFATGAYKLPKQGISNEENTDGSGNTISIPQFIFDDANAKYGWTEPPKGIPEIIKFLEVLFWLFLEQTGTPEGTLSTVTGMNSTANQLQVFIRTIESRQSAQTEGIKEIMTVLEAVNNLNSQDKVDLSGDIEWPEAFPDTATIKEMVIALLQDTGISDETKLEMVKNKYLADLPEWEVEKKRIGDQRKAEFEADINAHHDESDTIEE